MGARVPGTHFASQAQPGGTRGSLRLQHCGLASSLALNRDWEKQLHTLPPRGHLTPASQATPRPRLPFLPQRAGAAGALSESAVSSQPLPLGDFRSAAVLAAGPQEAPLHWETDRQEADRWATRPGPYPSNRGEAGEASGERRETAETDARVCTSVRVCMGVCARGWVCICMQIPMHANVCACTCVFHVHVHPNAVVFKCAGMCANAHECAYANAHVCEHM